MDKRTAAYTAVLLLSMIFYFDDLIAACAAASLAIGTLNGEHET